jgi:hypothetical protein
MRRTTGGSLLLTCLQKALEANPDYADAMFNLALLLQKLDRYGEGVVSTSLDSTSSWATRGS